MTPLRIIAAAEPYAFWDLRRGIAGILEGAGVPAARTDAGLPYQTPSPEQRVRVALLNVSSFLPTRAQLDLAKLLWRNRT